MKKLFCVALFALLSIIPVPSVQAATLTWTLENVVFDDGGTATGSFGYDADTNTFSAINITTSDNLGLGLGSNYVIGAGISTYVDFYESVPLAGYSRFLFDLVSAMTNAGGTIALALLSSIPDVEALCPDDNCTTANNFRYLTQGFVTTSPVPIPAALPLFAAGLSALGLMGWRRKRRAA